MQPSEAKVYPIQCDLTSESDILRAFEWIETTVGQGVSVMINNTGALVKSKILGAYLYYNEISVTIIINCQSIFFMYTSSPDPVLPGI